MKRKLIFASHGGLAAGLYDTTQMIIGEIPWDAEVFSLQPGHHPKEFAEPLSREIRDNAQTEYVILCDLYGASVFTALYPLALFPNVKVFTGMNLGMVLSVCLECEETIDEKAAEKLIHDAREGILQARISEMEQEDF